MDATAVKVEGVVSPDRHAALHLEVPCGFRRRSTNTDSGKQVEILLAVFPRTENSPVKSTATIPFTVHVFSSALGMFPEIYMMVVCFFSASILS